MKKLFTIVILFTSLAGLGLAQDKPDYELTREGFKVFDATAVTFTTAKHVNKSSAMEFTAILPSQTFTATFTFSRKFEGTSQQAADRKLAAYLAAYAESKGKSGLCVVAGDGACLSEQGMIVYDLALVQAAVESILVAEIDGAAKGRFTSSKVDTARKQAEKDFDEKEEKPLPTIAPTTIRPILRRPQRRR